MQTSQSKNNIKLESSPTELLSTDKRNLSTSTHINCITTYTLQANKITLNMK